MSDDLIDEFVGIVTPWCDAPPSFIEAGGYYLVSDLLGRFFRCTQMPHGGRPNLWFIMASIPGRMRRSSVQNYTDRVREKALRTYYEKINLLPDFRAINEEREKKKLDKLTDDDKREITEEYWSDLIFDNTIEEGTPEGIADRLEGADQKVFAILSTEIGGVFAKMKTRDYYTGVATLLSKLYYGEGGSVALSRRGGKKGGRRIPKHLYVTMFAGMQEPREYLNTKMVRQGLLRRILIDYVVKNERWLDPLMDGREQIYQELDVLAVKFAELMVKYHNNTFTGSPNLLDVYFNPRVLKAINNSAKKLDAAIDEEPNDLNILRQSMWEHFAKLAMLKRIAEARLEMLGGLKQVTVSTGNLKSAGNFVRPIANGAELIVDSLEYESEAVRTSEKPVKRVLKLIIRGGRQGIKRSDLLNQSKLKAGELDVIISTLIQSEKITQEYRGSTGGRKPKWYVAIV